MILIVLRGGLGNQMFQVLEGQILQHEFGQTVKYSFEYMRREPHFEDHINSLSRLKLQDIRRLGRFTDLLLTYFFRIKLSLLKAIYRGDTQNYNAFTLKRGVLKLSDVHRYESIRPVRGINYYDAYFQNVNYFKNVSSAQLDKLRVNDSYHLDKQNRRILTRIQASDAVCVHVRRGDYTNSKWAKDLLICDENYYKTAMNLMRDREPDAKFFIFSNTHSDIEWIKQNYKLGDDVEYVDLGNSDYQELLLMYNCKHFILSNSSFSWWAQKLSIRRGVVIAPDRWDNTKDDSSGIYENDWVKIHV